MQKQNIYNLTYKDLSKHFVDIGEKPFRATQVFEWLYKRCADNFDAMTNLSDTLRERLKKDFCLRAVKNVKEQKSSDGTIKLLFELKDSEKIETVVIPTARRTTVCVSTQVGCKFGCKFCASGIGGWKRNLSCAEIIEQIIYVKNYYKKASISHIVFMGVGEPLDNYDNLLKAVYLINSSKGMNIAARRITISTSGLIPGIEKFSKEGVQVELSVSLHSPFDETRDSLMPVNKKYPVAKLINACKDYVKKTNRQVTFEYLLIKDLTCNEKSAIQLGRLLKGLLCKINLILYNEVAEFVYKRPSREEIHKFKDKLDQLGIHFTIRAPRGRDISAACGQLRHKEENKS